MNFTEILQQLRRDLAVRYLDDRKLHVSKIAWMLGFTEVRAFTHACRRWTGKTPMVLNMPIRAITRQAEAVGSLVHRLAVANSQLERGSVLG